MNERPGGCGAGEGSGRRARGRGPKDPRRPWKGEERRSTRPVAEGGGAAGGGLSGKRGTLIPSSRRMAGLWLVEEPC